MEQKNDLECSTCCDLTPIILDIINGINKKDGGMEKKTIFMWVNKQKFLQFLSTSLLNGICKNVTALQFSFIVL